MGIYNDQDSKTTDKPPIKSRPEPQNPSFPFSRPEPQDTPTVRPSRPEPQEPPAEKPKDPERK